jgi:hypothetical protein
LNVLGRRPLARGECWLQARDDREGLAALIDYARTGKSVRHEFHPPRKDSDFTTPRRDAYM